MLENFIQTMVGNDPLYLVDESRYLLEPALNHWNDTYKNRLREYHIEETFDQPILDKLPDSQFGVCLVYNYLNYRPYELIQKYLKEVYEKLRPGGVLIMTFNDCDYHNAMQLVEQNITCYTPGTLVKGYANFLGFEEIFEYRDTSPSVWIELKKPGTITSIRGGQALAKILPKPVAKSE
jgi:SAM-dependent methyltransferase